ncbi:P-loop NTPase fold protein [Aestuariicoccus sp. MJ-SS9]|uniref:KAP family P-loop NTPase fold protein n=1 Tax=Aestuariicoccus sp. MJ-SS9 TaxID=3079855 RepID=UPI00290A0BD1|nr:P-loop NTPase fold protein [Aestuariicoccus sp. MJ-SS9]MDU8912427.1 P-loop NTPase fold protein [Aestuariicoccus sp. MJ-SS9]
MRLTVPEPKIDLYNEGFEKHCRLGRAKDGQKLSDLVERVSEPMVVALDAPWGAGKSVFLKCWVGAHVAENGGTATTVYFDAFKHDYLDDPLVSIVGVVAERLESLGGSKSGSAKKKGLAKVKSYAPMFGRALLRLGIAYATAGALHEIPDPTQSLADDALDAGSKELGDATRDFWRTEENRRNAMEGFREGLSQVASDETKLVIVVDELDRCRPDYALSLLEVIKHFFDVPNVHFILGVNSAELANSVRARYGSGVQAEKYLQKFITLTMPLVPRPARRGPSTQLQIDHFRYVSEQLGLEASWKFRWLETYLGYVDHHAGLGLRDVERIAALAVLTPEPIERPEARLHLYTGLIILKVHAPGLIQKAKDGSLNNEDVFRIFKLRGQAEIGGARWKAHACWVLATLPDGQIPESVLDEWKIILFLDYEPSELLRDTLADCIEAFQI